MIDEFREESVEVNRRCSSGDGGGASGASSGNGGDAPSQQQKQQQQAQAQWQQWGPTSSCGAINPCFRGGFLFRLYDEASHTWTLYNDTFTFEMHCSFMFEKGVPVKVLSPRVQVENVENGDTRYSVVVYPMETIDVMRATRGRNKAQFDGKPLSKEYLSKELEEATPGIEDGLQRLARYTNSNRSEEVLRVCKERKIAFIDPEFPPSSASFEQNPSSSSTPSSTATGMSSTAVVKPSAWRRPEEYLPPRWSDQVRLFRHPIKPSVVQRGELGDSWVISAIAALSENAKYVRDMFRHPGDPKETAEEEMLGARRVLLNKDGLWHSTLVDSYLPMKGKQQRFARCANDFCEMWVSYLEKAYAKRNHSYGNIISGDPLFALRDFTGFPTTRLDAKFRACRNDEEASAALFDRLAADCENGHQILLSTPLSGESTTVSTTELKEQGILVGYAYTVLEMTQVAPLTRLLRVRNPWAAATEWKGNWSVESPRWGRCPEAAAAFPVHDGSDGTVIFSWEEVLTYFIGCGVVFNHFDYADYRIPSRFDGAHSQLCLEISVTEPTQLTFVLSQEDRRTRQEPDLMTEYAPLVLSIAGSSADDGGGKPITLLSRAPSTIQPECNGRSSNTSGTNPVNGGDAIVGGPRNNRDGATATKEVAPARLSLLTNSTADTEHPTSNLVFLQGRDVSIMHTFVPERSPYLVVPRRLVRDGDCQELPFVLGVLSQLPFTAFGQAHVRLRRLPANSMFYDNYMSFNNVTEELRTTFQVRRSAASVTQQTGAQLNPEE